MAEFVLLGCPRGHHVRYRTSFSGSVKCLPPVLLGCEGVFLEEGHSRRPELCRSGPGGEMESPDRTEKAVIRYWRVPGAHFLGTSRLLHLCALPPERPSVAHFPEVRNAVPPQSGTLSSSGHLSEQKRFKTYSWLPLGASARTKMAQNVLLAALKGNCAKTADSAQSGSKKHLDCAETPRSGQRRTFLALDCAESGHSWQRTPISSLDCAKKADSGQSGGRTHITCRKFASWLGGHREITGYLVVFRPF